MSSNRIIYDTCSYKEQLKRSTGTLGYMLNKNMHENKSKCFHGFGLLGGKSVSLIKGNQVDLESSLRGQGYPLTKCNEYQHSPNRNVLLSHDGSVKTDINTSLNNLNTCQMFGYQAVPLPDRTTY